MVHSFLITLDVSFIPEKKKIEKRERFNEEDKIFQLYSRVIIKTCHKDVTLTAIFIPKIISIWYTMT